MRALVPLLLLACVAGCEEDGEQEQSADPPWALTIRTNTFEPRGMYTTPQAELHLFADYHNDCCLNSRDPMGADETYARTFVAVSGSVTFESEHTGWIDVTMQEESPVRSGSTFGPEFRLQACWNIGGESGASGCQL